MEECHEGGVPGLSPTPFFSVCEGRPNPWGGERGQPHPGSESRESCLRASCTACPMAEPREHILLPDNGPGWAWKPMEGLHSRTPPTHTHTHVRAHTHRQHDSPSAVDRKLRQLTQCPPRTTYTPQDVHRASLHHCPFTVGIEQASYSYWHWYSSYTISLYHCLYTVGIKCLLLFTEPVCTTMCCRATVGIEQASY